MDTCQLHQSKGNCVEIVPIFATLSPEELDKIGAITSDRIYQKGEAIYRAGECKGTLYLIHTGRVRVYRLSPDGKEQLIRIVGPGQFLGELSLFSTRPTTDYADASEEAELCMIAGERLKGLMDVHPSIALKVMEELSKRLEDAESLIEDINLRSVGQRLARFLLGEATEDHEFLLNMSKGDLASRLGMSQETLSRKLATFQERGLLELRGQRGVRGGRGQRGIALLDMASLKAISNGD